MRKVKISTLRKKADRALQEYGRRTYSRCEVCGKPMACLHHFWPKSTSSALRYEEANLIPICFGCHFRHHNGDPTIHATIIENRGDKWFKSLKAKKETITKVSKGLYLSIIKKYET